MKQAIMQLLKGEEGISSVEYAILLAFIATVLITAVTGLRGAVVTAFTNATACLTGGGACPAG